jgi:hypothetical protein
MGKNVFILISHLQMNYLLIIDYLKILLIKIRKMELLNMNQLISQIILRHINRILFIILRMLLLITMLMLLCMKVSRAMLLLLLA